MLFSKIKVATLVMLIVVGTVLGTGTLIVSVSRAKEKDGQEQQAPAPPKEIVGEVTLTEVGAAYGGNDAFGDEKFGSKRLRVTGTMHFIRRLSSGGTSQYWLTMHNGQSGYWGLFKFNLNDRKQLAELKGRQELTIEGRCEGRILEGNQPRIEFSDCKIVSVNK